MAFAATSLANPAAQRSVECAPCNLRFDLAAARASYQVGEPVSLSITITNTGPEPVELQRTSDITGRHDGYRFEVANERGDRIADPGLAAVSLRHTLGWFWPLAPQASDSRQLILNYQVAPLKPGRYIVKGWLNSQSCRASAERRVEHDRNHHRTDINATDPTAPRDNDPQP